MRESASKYGLQILTYAYRLVHSVSWCGLARARNIRKHNRTKLAACSNEESYIIMILVELYVRKRINERKKKHILEPMLDRNMNLWYYLSPFFLTTSVYFVVPRNKLE